MGQSHESAFIVDDEGDIRFADNVLDSMEEEVQEYMSQIKAENIRKIDGRYICALCPFKSFHRLPQLRAHVGRYHVAAWQFVCSGKKQLKVILALHDADCGRKQFGAEYLFRSSLLLRRQVSPPLSCQQNGIDKFIRLVFSGEGPMYVNADAIGETVVARRVLNIYYDKSFAEILLREIVLHHSNEPWPLLSVRVCQLSSPFVI